MACLYEFPPKSPLLGLVEDKQVNSSLAHLPVAHTNPQVASALNWLPGEEQVKVGCALSEGLEWFVVRVVLCSCLLLWGHDLKDSRDVWRAGRQNRHVV